MNNSVQEAVAISDISMVESQGMSLSETLHHTIHLALFCLGVTLLSAGPDVTTSTPFTGMLLLIPAMTAGIHSLAQLTDVPRWLQRGGIIAIYAAIVVSVAPSAPLAATAVFTAVAATSFLAPTVTTLSRVTVVFAAMVFAGLLVAIAVV